jgi:hypothetical protein
MLKMQVRVRIDDKEKDVFTYHDFPVEQLKFKRPKFEKEEKEEIPEDVKDLLDE